MPTRTLAAGGHPSIFALRGGTPILALSSKTFKMRALADMAGLSAAPSLTLSHMEGETHAIGRQLVSYLEQGSDLRSRLSSWGDGIAPRGRTGRRSCTKKLKLAEASGDRVVHTDEGGSERP